MENNPPLPHDAFRDIRFEKLTFIDPLTRLFNQYYLSQFLPEEIKKADLSKYSLAIVMLDMDNFKSVNDTYGHLAGDEVLKQFSSVLKKTVRTTDSVIRYAGDEFILLLPGADTAQAQRLCFRLVSDVSKYPFAINNGTKTVLLTVSIGFSVYPEDGIEPLKLIDQADKALYFSKRKGRNRASCVKEITPEEVSFSVAMDAFPCPTFVNRKEVMDKLRQMLHEVERSHALKFVFAAGPQGVGKTRILKEISRDLQNRTIALQCEATSVHSQDPYYIFAKGISDYLGNEGIESGKARDLFSGIPAPEVSELSLIIPQIRGIMEPASIVEEDGSKRRLLLFKALCDVLFGLERSLPVAIILDDLQWADAASLKLLSYIITRAKDKRIFIICAFSIGNPADEKIENNFGEFLEELRGSNALVEIAVHNLSPEDSSAMIQAIVPDISCPGEFVQWIYDVTQGSPAFIEEVLKSLLENKFILYRNKGWELKEGITKDDIPTSLEKIIYSRVRNLDDETKEMILQAAVIGDNFPVSLLRELGGKSEGMIDELIERTKKLRLIDNPGRGEKFRFLSKDTQRILYNELGEEQRNKLHYQIAQILSQQKDNLYPAAGELAYHFKQAPQQEHALELSKQFLGKASDLFAPHEFVKYLEALAQDMEDEQENGVAEISETKKKEVISYIRYLLGAIKKVRFYPPASATRTEAIKELARLLKALLDEVEALNLAETEKSLVVNGKRLTPKETEEADAEQLLFILMQHNIKSITFKKETAEDELKQVIELLSLQSQAIIEQGGWKALLREKGVRSIKINEVLFAPVGKAAVTSTQKKKMESMMLMEFLLGKVDHTGVNKNEISSYIQSNPKQIAQALEEFSEKVAKDGGKDNKTEAIVGAFDKLSSEIVHSGSHEHPFAVDLAKVLLELDPKLRNDIFRSQFLKAGPGRNEALGSMVNSLDEELIANLHIEAYNENRHDLLALKDMAEGLAVTKEKKEKILAKLEAEFLKLGVDRQEIDFISGKIYWKDLPLEKRIQNILALSPGRYTEEATKIKNVLEELEGASSKEALRSFLRGLFDKMGHLELHDTKGLLAAITDFVKNPSERQQEVSATRTQTIDLLSERLLAETDAQRFTHLLGVVSELITNFVAKLSASKELIFEVQRPSVQNELLIIMELFFALEKRLHAEESRDPELYGLISSFIVKICQPQFLEIAVYGSIAGENLKHRYKLKELGAIAGDQFIDTLISLATRKSDGLWDPYREYVSKKAIAGLIKDAGGKAIERIKQVLPGIEEDAAPAMIELAGFLKNETLIEYVMPFIHHEDSFIRKTAVLALVEIGGPAGIEALSRVIKETKDKELRNLAKIQLQQLKNTWPPYRK